MELIWSENFCKRSDPLNVNFFAISCTILEICFIIFMARITKITGLQSVKIWKHFENFCQFSTNLDRDHFLKTGSGRDRDPHVQTRIWHLILILIFRILLYPGFTDLLQWGVTKMDQVYGPKPGLFEIGLGNYPTLPALPSQNRERAGQFPLPISKSPGFGPCTRSTLVTSFNFSYTGFVC